MNVSDKELVKSRLSRSLFWDVSYEILDMDRNASFIIARVMDRGTKGDVELVRSYYNESQIRNALIMASDLDKRTVVYFSELYGIERKLFRAYQRKSVMRTWGH